MSSIYAGNGATFLASLSLMTGGDTPTALLFRVPLQRLLDNCVNLDSRVGGIAGSFIDGANGGTYTPGANIVLAGTSEFRPNRIRLVSGAIGTVASGAEIDLAGILKVQSGGDIDILSGGSLHVETGANINQTGTYHVQTGGVFTVDAGGSVVFATGSPGGAMTVESGAVATFQSGGQASFARAQDLKIASASVAFRMTSGPAFLSQTSGPGSETWAYNVGGGVAQYRQVDPSVAAEIWFPITRPNPGDVLTSVVVKLAADTHVSLPASMPLVQVRSVATDGTTTTIGSVTDSSASTGTYQTPHNVTLSLSDTVTSDAWYVVVVGEHGAFAVANLLLQSISVTATVKTYLAGASHT